MNDSSPTDTGQTSIYNEEWPGMTMMSADNLFLFFCYLTLVLLTPYVMYSLYIGL